MVIRDGIEAGAVGKWAGGLSSLVPSLGDYPVRLAALRNPGHGSRESSTVKLNRQIKPSVRLGGKATGLAGQIHGLPRHSRVSEVNG